MRRTFSFSHQNFASRKQWFFPLDLHTFLSLFCESTSTVGLIYRDRKVSPTGVQMAQTPPHPRVQRKTFPSFLSFLCSEKTREEDSRPKPGRKEERKEYILSSFLSVGRPLVLLPLCFWEEEASSHILKGIFFLPCWMWAEREIEILKPCSCSDTWHIFAYKKGLWEDPILWCYWLDFNFITCAVRGSLGPIAQR